MTQAMLGAEKGRTVLIPLIKAFSCASMQESNHQEEKREFQEEWRDMGLGLTIRGRGSPPSEGTVPKI